MNVQLTTKDVPLQPKVDVAGPAVPLFSRYMQSIFLGDNSKTPSIRRKVEFLKIGHFVDPNQFF